MVCCPPALGEPPVDPCFGSAKRLWSMDRLIELEFHDDRTHSIDWNNNRGCERHEGSVAAEVESWF